MFVSRSMGGLCSGEVAQERGSGVNGGMNNAVCRLVVEIDRDESASTVRVVNTEARSVGRATVDQSPSARSRVAIFLTAWAMVSVFLLVSGADGVVSRVGHVKYCCEHQGMSHVMR